MDTTDGEVFCWLGMLIFRAGLLFSAVSIAWSLYEVASYGRDVAHYLEGIQTALWRLVEKKGPEE